MDRTRTPGKTPVTLLAAGIAIALTQPVFAQQPAGDDARAVDMATVTVTGEASRWSSTAYLVVGGAGDGALNVVDGGTVKVGPTGGGTLTLANSGSSAGTLNIGAPAGEAALPAGTIQAEPDCSLPSFITCEAATKPSSALPEAANW